jgi:nucleoside-diphosphate-sugar epimerase
MSRRILITGHNGYIGSVMTATFLRAGYDVVGLDTEYFRPCAIIPELADVPRIRKDIRDLHPDDLRGFYAVVHLAALSNDPLGDLNRGWTEDINFRASARLAEMAREAGTERFLLSSSCIMYGMSEASVVDERSPLDPQTDYARTKVQAERAIAELASDHFSPTFLRNGTVYGLSPRMRFDTVFNNLMGAAAANGRVVVYTDGKPWRPVIHVQDVARAFLAALEAPRSWIHNEAFNTGANHLNYQVIRLAEIAVDAVPGCQLEVLAQSSADQRTYQADFSKFAQTFSHFEFEWTPHKGARELLAAFRSIRLTPEVLSDKRYTRLKWLKHLLDTKQLDGSLRWCNGNGNGNGKEHHG